MPGGGSCDYRGPMTNPIAEMSEAAKINLDVRGLDDEQVEDIRRHVRGLQDGDETYNAPRRGWTCFHCGETFKTEGVASLHFGTIEDAFPRCAEGARKAFKMLTERAAEQAISQADELVAARKSARHTALEDAAKVAERNGALHSASAIRRLQSEER
jgi:hypothetical protein